MRAVLDANVIVSALLSPGGAPAHILSRWLAGEFELVLSEGLLAELERTFAYPKLRRRISADEAAELVDLLKRSAVVRTDQAQPPARSPDPGDDYLLALAEREGAVLVSGDGHLLGLADRFPILAPSAFLENLRTAP